MMAELLYKLINITKVIVRVIKVMTYVNSKTHTEQDTLECWVEMNKRAN